ncbi:protein rolling stone-like [Branchiostoma floridae x Branchiostoma japonicum]
MDPSEKGRLGFISREPLPERTAFTSTPWSPNQKLFVTYRVVCAVFTLAILIWSVPTDSNRWITFYSNWMYATLTLHFCWSATICLQQYCSTHEGPSERTLYIGWIIYDMAMTISLTVSAEYWFSPWPVTIGLRSILRHGLNSVMVVIDVILCGIPSRMDHVVYPVLHQGFYGVFVVLYWLGGFRGYDGKQYIYSFLDLNTVPLQAIGILLGNTFIVMPVFHALSSIFTDRAGRTSKLLITGWNREVPSPESTDRGLESEADELVRVILWRESKQHVFRAEVLRGQER